MDSTVPALSAESLPLSPTDILYMVHDPFGSPSDIYASLATLDARFAKVFSVKEYGAKGDNATDDTVAIQAAVDAAHAFGGAVVHFPAAIYKITANINIYSGITLKGAGMESTIVRQVTSNQHGITGTAVSSLIIEDMTWQGNGSGSTAGTGTGIGCFLQYGGAGNNPFHNFRNVSFRNWGSDGIKIQTAIVSSFQKVISEYNGGHGFNWYEGGTSCNFQACWARQNALAGYRFFESVYQSLTGCAADNNGTNYMVLSAQSIGFFGCGSEGALTNTGLYNGFGFYIDNSSVIKLSGCWIADNRNLGVWVTNGANDIALNVADNTPNGTAVNFITVDVGCNATIYELHNTTANSLLGTVLIINDGNGAISAAGDLALKAGTSKLVKSTVLRQDDTTNTYEVGNTVKLTGRGHIVIGAASNASINITFGKTFVQPPIVNVSYAGDHASSTTFSNAGNNVKGPVAIKKYAVTTTGCTIHIHSSDGTAWAASNVVFFDWQAEGEIT